MATDINLHVHPDATTAFLQRGESMWFLVYTGRPGFSRQMQPITNGEIDGALSALCRCPTHRHKAQTRPRAVADAGLCKSRQENRFVTCRWRTGSSET